MIRTPPLQQRSLIVAASESNKNSSTTSVKDEIVFKPFQEVQPQLKGVDQAELDSPTRDFARVRYSAECEAAVNEQINIEYSISYIYHSFYAYFDRDNVGLPGIAKFFKEQSEEERGHAELFMSYQNKRGGRVKLHTLTAPEVEYENEEKGEALHAFELALSLEKLNLQKLWVLDDIATKAEDYEMASFVEEMLHNQVEEVKRSANQVAQLRRVGKGLGVFEFDQRLDSEGEAMSTGPGPALTA